MRCTLLNVDPTFRGNEHDDGDSIVDELVSTPKVGT